jgi:2-oxoglutarate dehydrogenase E2 component (dihydrolipoamide succinyltransferase)
MAFQVKVPSVGESVTSGVLGAWSKKAGDYVRAGEPVLEIETDKVTFEVFAECSGVLKPLVETGATVQVGQIIAEIAESAAPASAPAPEDAAQTETPHGQPQPADAVTRTSALSSAPAQPSAAPLSPAVRTLVEEHKLNPGHIPATGKEGRLTKGDVLAYVASRPAPAPSAPAPASVPPAVTPAPVPNTRITRKPMSQLRRKVADRLLAAQQNAAILTTFNEADMSNILALRERFQDRFHQAHGIKLGFMSFFVQAVVHALRSVPQINARLDGNDIVQQHYYDIGVAISTERGLMVPVVRNADRLSLADIEKAIADYASRARSGKITLADLDGGVFTITNGGIFGSLLSTPILNPPQSGILGMHAIQERPVAIKGRVEIRPMMYLALSYDHRLVDGREAVTFLVRVKEFIENPATGLMGL